MGSGLILFVIVGAWLAVLVPMAVKGHDTSTSLRSVDRFGDAMNVLSRRAPGDSREVVMPRRPVHEPLYPPLSAAERRKRTLLSLLGLALVTLGLGLMGSTVLIAVHVLCDLLLVSFMVHLRKQAVARAAQRRPAARPAARLAARPATARVAGIPDRMPLRPAHLTAPLPAPAARYDDAAVPATAAVVAPAAAATGTDGSWSPVPVPPPVYVGKAVAPSRPPRVLDLTKPGEWTAVMDDASSELLEDGRDLEDILDRRRVSGGW